MVANYNLIQAFAGSIELPANLTDADTLLYFTHSSFAIENSLWRTDSTSAEPLRIIGESEGLNLDRIGVSTGTNGKLFFNASNDGTNFEPWISDGTTEGTTILKDINPDGGSNPQNFYALGDTVIFTASDGNIDENRLWTTDGTTEGTQEIELVFAENTELNPVNFADRDIDGSLYFTAQGDANVSLWQTDGTQAGTNQVLVLSSVGIPNDINNITVVGDRLFFTTNTSNTPGSLWTNDGTSDGTNLVIDGLNFDNAGERGELVGVNDTLFFAANDGTTGLELWKSDSTAEGTTLVKDITFGEQSSSITDLTVVEGTLYFINDSELWTSDGTEGGTFKIESPRFGFPGETFNSLEEITSIQDLSEFNDQLYLSAKVPSSPTPNNAPALLSLSDIDDPAGSPIYRLFNPELGTHFYTIDNQERSDFLDSGYQFEGESFAAVLPNAESSEEVYRFFNEATGGYLYTTDEAERDNIQANSPDFAFQGTAFNVYETQVDGSLPVYRFLDSSMGVHFYTFDEAERASLEGFPNYNFEGIAYYAFPSVPTLYQVS